MKCPNCFKETKVRYTTNNDDSVMRARKCQECGYEFRTIEIDADLYDKYINMLHEMYINIIKEKNKKAR